MDRHPHARWTVWRQDDNGARFRVAAYDDRVGALARLLGLEAGLPHKQLYWIEGPGARPVADPACRVAALADADALPAPDSYLAALRAVAAPLADRPGLDRDTVAALFVAAAGYGPRGEPWPSGASEAFAAFDRAVLRASRRADAPTAALLRAVARRARAEPAAHAADRAEHIGWDELARWVDPTGT